MNIELTREESLGSSTVADDASVWDARLRSPDCSDNDRASFAVWRDANQQHRDAFERLQTIVASLRHDGSRADVRALRDEGLRAIRRRRRSLWFTTAAACLAVLGVGIAVWQAPGGDWLRGSLGDLVARLSGTEIYTTGTGQRSMFLLKDGSTVELNAQSRIKVTFTEFRRSVELVKGQGLFNVAKNPRRPFVVSAGDRQIVAVGTLFDVRLDEHSVQVTLIEGKVNVDRTGFDQTVLTSSRSQSLVAGQQLVALLPAKKNSAAILTTVVEKQGSVRSNNGEPEGETVLVRPVDTAKVAAWRDGRVLLEDQPLAVAIAEMNRYSPVQIIIEDSILEKLRINGMFRAGEQDAFIAALEEYFPISARRRGDEEIVLTAR